MARDINLYINSLFRGSFELEHIEKLFSQYESKALFLSEFIEWDEVILYAVLQFEDNKFISADFMLHRMPYNKYYELCRVISDDCRIFFKRNQNY